MWADNLIDVRASIIARKQIASHACRACLPCGFLRYVSLSSNTSPPVCDGAHRMLDRAKILWACRKRDAWLTCKPVFESSGSAWHRNTPLARKKTPFSSQWHTFAMQILNTRGSWVPWIGGSEGIIIFRSDFASHFFSKTTLHDLILTGL